MTYQVSLAFRAWPEAGAPCKFVHLTCCPPDGRGEVKALPDLAESLPSSVEQSKSCLPGGPSSLYDCGSRHPVSVAEIPKPDNTHHK